MTKSVPAQQHLFQVETQVEFDGVEMGVLENGMPFLSETGLARMCGIDRKVLSRLAANWDDERFKPRGKKINQLLEILNYTESSLFLRCQHNGSATNAYTEPVCLALLEYYAFEADEPRTEAQHAFRTLARTTFRTFIYNATGYTPEQKALDSWKHYHDRIDMTATNLPAGFFGVFQEIAVMIVPMIRAGVFVSDRVVPDISVGKAWSSYWESNKLSAKYGERTKYPHSYPDYYPQAKSNPQPSFAYPMAALGEFRGWLQSNYVSAKFPTYILGQAKKGTIDASTAKLTLSAFGAPQIAH